MCPVKSYLALLRVNMQVHKLVKKNNLENSILELLGQEPATFSFRKTSVKERAPHHLFCF